MKKFKKNAQKIDHDSERNFYEEDNVVKKGNYSLNTSVLEVSTAMRIINFVGAVVGLAVATAIILGTVTIASKLGVFDVLNPSDNSSARATEQATSQVDETDNIDRNQEPQQ